MPRISDVHHVWSARWVLFARCYYCEYLLTWVHDQDDENKMAATCCDLAYLAKVSESTPAHFDVFLFEADHYNVVQIDRKWRKR